MRYQTTAEPIRWDAGTVYDVAPVGSVWFLSKGAWKVLLYRRLRGAVEIEPCDDPRWID